MKKLTAGIFTVLLGIVSVSAADAKIASQGYVDEKVGGVSSSVSTLSETVGNHTTTINKLDGADTVAGSVAYQVKAAKEAAAADATDKVNKLANGQVKTNKENIETLQGQVGDESGGLTKQVADLKTTVDGLTGDNGGVATQIAEALSGYYTKGAVDDAVGLKQAKSTADYQLGNKDGGWTALTDAEKAALQSGATAEKIGKITTNETAIGTLTSLNTTEKTNLVGAINEVKTAADKIGTLPEGADSVVDLINSKTGAESELAKDVEANGGAIDDLKTNLSTLATTKIPAACQNSESGCTLVYRNNAFIWEDIERSATETTAQ